MPSLTIAEWFLTRMFSKRRTLIISFALPAIVVSAFLMLLHFGEQEKPTISIVSHDKSPISVYLITELAREFTVNQTATEEELRNQVFQRVSAAGIIIPAEFHDMVLQGNPETPPTIAQVQLGVNEATISLQSMLNLQLQDILQVAHSYRQAGLQGQELTTRVLNLLEEKAKDRVYAKITDMELYVSPTLRISMGMFLMFMLLSSVNCVAIMMEDKQNYTMQRTYAAPVRAWQIALGQFVGGFIFGSLQIAVILLLTRGILGIHMSMTLLQQWALLELFLIAGMGMACVLGAIIGNAEHFSRISFVLIAPTCMISGCYWPVELMSDNMQKLSYFIPQRWVLDAMELLAAGGTWTTILLHIGVLILFGIVLLGIGSVVLRPGKREAV